MSLKGGPALVAAVTRQIGRIIAAKPAARVALTYRTAADLDLVVSGSHAVSAEVHALVLDVTAPSASEVVSWNSSMARRQADSSL